MVKKKVKKISPKVFKKQTKGKVNSEQLPAASMEITFSLSLPSRGTNFSHFIAMKPKVENIPIENDSIEKTMLSIFDELHTVLKERIPKLIDDALEQ